MKNFIKSIIFYEMPKSLIEKKDLLKNKINKDVTYRIVNFGDLNPDKIFYVIKRFPGAGLFSNFTYVLNHLRICHHLGYIPIIDMENFPSWYNEVKKIKNTKNSWEYYFEQTSDYKLEEVYKSKNVIFTDNIYHKNFSRVIFEDKELYFIFKRYIKIKKHILTKQKKFFEKNFKNKKVLGVYLRGGEFRTIPNHDYPPTNIQIIEKVKKTIKANDIDKIFLSSKELEHISLFEKNFPGKFVYYDSFRSKKDFFTYYPRENHRYLLGEEIFCEMLSLSMCDYLIYSLSNVSQASIFFNINKNQKRFYIDNGINSSNRLIARFSWFVKSILPSFFGGFKKNI